MELIEALFCEVNPIPVKSALNLMGFAAGIPRMPLTELEEVNKRKLEQAMKAYGIMLTQKGVASTFDSICAGAHVIMV